MDEEFLEKIEKVVKKHPSVYYLTEIEDTHIKLCNVPNDPLNDVFCNVWREYNHAQFNSIRQLIRYEKSLFAWDHILKGIDEEIMSTVSMDYVFPVFRVACDIPNTFKDQVIRGVVKLKRISTNDFSLISQKDFKKSKRTDWIEEFKKISNEDANMKNLYEVINCGLYESQDAEHLRELHGHAVHDSSQTLVSGKPVTICIAQGATLFACENSLNLTEELKIIDRQRLVIQGAYKMFDEYVSILHRGLSGH